MKAINQLLPAAGAFLAMALYAGAGTAAGLNVASDPVIFGGLPAADTEEKSVCFDETTGQLGQCSGSNVGGIYPANIIWVAQSGGDYTDLREALAGITDASTDNRYLIRIAPGVYELGNTPLLLKPFVDIEGSGMHLTVLRGSVGSTSIWVGLFNGANDTVLKELTLKNECNHQLCAAMYNQGVSPNIERVKIIVTNQVGSVTNGVHNAYSASPTFKNTIIEVAANSGGNQGIYSYDNCEVTIIRSKITAEGAGGNEGVHNHRATSFIEHSTIVASTNTVVNNHWSQITPVAKARIYASRLSGGPVAAINGAEAYPANLSCAGVTDENNVFEPSICP